MVMMVLGTPQQLPVHSRRSWTRLKLHSTYVSEAYLLVPLLCFPRHHGYKVVFLRLVFDYDLVLLESAGSGVYICYFGVVLGQSLCSLVVGAERIGTMSRTF